MKDTYQIIFIAFCFYSPFIIDRIIKSIKEYDSPPVKIIEKPIPVKKIKSHRVENINYKEVPQKIIEPESVKIPANKIFDDCVMCLVSLGMKKKQAKEKTQKMFDKNNYQSIESFLLDVYKIE